MIGSLTRSAALAATLTIPRSGTVSGQTVIVAGKPTTLLAAQTLVNAIPAKLVLPTELVRVPARPPMPSSRPIVQAGQPIPMLPPSAALTSLAPSYVDPGPGPSAVAVEAPNDARLPAPFPFGTAMLSDPIYPEDEHDAPEPASYVAPTTPVRSSSSSVAVSAPASGASTKWMFVAGGLALLGGVGIVLHRKLGGKR